MTDGRQGSGRQFSGKDLEFHLRGHKSALNVSNAWNIIDSLLPVLHDFDEPLSSRKKAATNLLITFWIISRLDFRDEAISFYIDRLAEDVTGFIVDSDGIYDDRTYLLACKSRTLVFNQDENDAITYSLKQLRDQLKGFFGAPSPDEGPRLVEVSEVANSNTAKRSSFW